MKKIECMKDLAPKPSIAVRAMIDGLENVEDYGFCIDMTTFFDAYGRGKFEVDECYGCAATAALCSLNNVHIKEATEEYCDANDIHPHDVSAPSERAQIYGLDCVKPDDLKEFEEAIDNLRQGYLMNFFKFWALNYVPAVDEIVSEYGGRWFFEDDNEHEYPAMLEQVGEFADELEQAGY